MTYKEDMDFKNICLYETSLKQRKKIITKGIGKREKKGSSRV